MIKLSWGNDNAITKYQGAILKIIERMKRKVKERGRGVFLATRLLTGPSHVPLFGLILLTSEQTNERSRNTSHKTKTICISINLILTAFLIMLSLYGPGGPDLAV